VTKLTTGGLGFDSRQGLRRFSIRHRLQISSEDHRASCPMGTRGLSLGQKRPGREVDLSPPTNAGVKKVWIYTSTSHTFSWRGA